MSTVGTGCTAAGPASPAIRASSSPAARRPIAAGSWATTVTPGGEQFRGREVAEADQGDEPLPAEPVQPAERRDRHRLPRGEQRRRPVRPAEERLTADSAAPALGTSDHERRVGGQPGRGQAAAVAGDAHGRCPTVARSPR